LKTFGAFQVLGKLQINYLEVSRSWESFNGKIWGFPKKWIPSRREIEGEFPKK
jgi:hypothetical protein